MEQILNEIKVVFTDSEINNILKSIKLQNPVPYTMHFNQNEDFFIQIPSEIFVPQLPIHHDIRSNTPNANYVRLITQVIEQICVLIPELLEGLTYFFDPAEILKPCFYRLYKIEDVLYLYLLRIDLNPRLLEVTVKQSGSNDITASYYSKRLYLESELIPLEKIITENPALPRFLVDQIISQTWIGETGRGYMVHGIWMDIDLSKFFSKAFIPQGKKIYPYYPLFCKYKTLCSFVPMVGSQGRKLLLPLFHKAKFFFKPYIPKIQEILKNQKFSENLPEFKEIASKVPDEWKKQLQNFYVISYLNQFEQKEFQITYENPAP